MKKISLLLVIGLLFIINYSPVEAVVTGDNDILVILVNFQDTEDLKTYQGPVTRESVRDIVFDSDKSVANFYNENSYGKINLGGDVFPTSAYDSEWYELSVNHNCNLSSIATMAMQVLDESGDGADVDFLSYEHLMVIIPDGSCLRGKSYVNPINISTPDGNKNMTVAFVEDNTMFSLYGVAHELGHGFGVQHAGSYNCGDYPYNASACSTVVSNDLFSIMSFAVSKPGQFSAPHKDRMNFFDNNHQLIELNVDNINNDGVYELSPYESMDHGIKAIKVRRDNGKFWYLEFRQPIGFDAWVGGSPEHNSVFIHTNNSVSMDPDSILINAGGTSWASSGLKVDTAEPHTGTTGFYDPVDEIKIEVVSMTIDEVNPTNSRAKVKIIFASEPALISEPSEEPVLINEPVVIPGIISQPINNPVDTVDELLNNQNNKAPSIVVTQVDHILTNRLRGKILLQVEDHGEAWYVNPDDGKRMYMADGTAAYGMMRNLGLGISDADLAKIPIGFEDRFECLDSDGDGLCDKLEDGLGTDKFKKDSDGDGYDDGVEVKGNYNPKGVGSMIYDNLLANRLKGKILLQVEGHGEAWYINPDDGKRYYMPDGPAAYQIMRFLSLGISNSDLSKIETE